MIPIRDENPTHGRAVVTILLIIACVGIYFFVQRGLAPSVVDADPQARAVDDIRFTLRNAAIPREVVERRPLLESEVDVTYGDPRASAILCTADPRDATDHPCVPGKNVYLAVLFSMFLHGSILHLAGNMLFLWVFGNNIEDKRGPVRYVGFYLLAGAFATLAHVGLDPGSPIPIVGASGAIAGVMGAYLVLFPNHVIHTAIFFGIILFRPIRAKWLLGIWLVSQFFISPSDGVAWAAHVGGFVFGVAVGLWWRARGVGDPVLRAPAY